MEHDGKPGVRLVNATTHRSGVYVCAVALILLLSLRVADARPARLGQIPNGAALGCAACHVNPAGGGARNVFGQIIETNFLSSAGFSGTVLWGPELAGLDADGDGATNGEELQDPNGEWIPGDPTPGDPSLVTLPHNTESRPPVTATAVIAESWGKVKVPAAGNR